MTRKDDIAASLSRGSRRRPRVAAEARPAEPAGEGAAVAASSGAARKVRLTVDVMTPEFREFRRWREDTAEELGRATVTNQDILRILVRQLLSDEDLQARVRATLQREAQ